MIAITEAAKDIVVRYGQEANKFPQALEDAFELAELEVNIQLSVIDKSEVFPGETGEILLRTEVTPLHEITLPVVQIPFVRYTNASDLGQLRVGTDFGFNALRTAKEVVRLYRQHYGVKE